MLYCRGVIETSHSIMMITLIPRIINPLFKIVSLHTLAKRDHAKMIENVISTTKANIMTSTDIRNHQVTRTGPGIRPITMNGMTANDINQSRGETTTDQDMSINRIVHLLQNSIVDMSLKWKNHLMKGNDVIGKGSIFVLVRKRLRIWLKDFHRNQQAHRRTSGEDFDRSRHHDHHHSSREYANKRDSPRKGNESADSRSSGERVHRSNRDHPGVYIFIQYAIGWYVCLTV